MSKLLINENPIVILPSLARKIGLNEAVVLQQMHYWLCSSKHEIEGKKWIYNTYKAWQSQMPFWHENTVKNTIKSLEEKGYLISANWNRSKMDKTKWYAIDYEKLEELEEGWTINNEPSTNKIEPSNEQELSLDEMEIVQAIPEITTETTTEKDIPFAEIIDYLNQKTEANYKASTQKTKQLIKERWKEGFCLEDFKTVIDRKAAEWKEPHWSKYLRPETLFGTKFESYVNQKAGKRKWREEDFDLDD